MPEEPSSYSDQPPYPPPPEGEAGWYREPEHGDRYEPSGHGWRYWDGERWTGHWHETDPRTPPSKAGWYPDPFAVGTKQERYSDGKKWVETGTVTNARFLAAMFWGLAMGGIFIVVLIALIILWRGPDGDDADTAGTTTTTSAGVVAGAECPPDLMGVDAMGAPICYRRALERTTTSSTVPTTAPTAANPAGPAGVACAPRTFAGSVTVGFEGWPAGTALTSEARFVLDAEPHADTALPGCRTTADLVWLGSGTDQRFRHEINPGGSFCSILLGEEAPSSEPRLNWTPDGDGGDTLTGTMHVKASVGWVIDYSEFAQSCPPVEHALQYAFPLDPPVAGQFTATVTDGTLVGAGTFVDPRGFAFDGLAPSGGIGGRSTYVVEVTATEVGG